MTSRPESGPKNLSPATQLDKQRETSRNAMTPIKVSKQLVQNTDGGEVNKVPSSSRVKSGKGMGAAIGILRVAAAMKFAGKIKRIKEEHHPEQEVDGKKSLTVNQTMPKIAIWDENLESLELKRKKASVIRKEINFTQTHVIPPTPDVIDVFVKKTQVCENVKKMQTYHVLKPCLQHSEWPEFKGPRFNNGGEIIPHSILGDVETFLGYASVNQDGGLQVPQRECKEKLSTSEKSLDHSLGTNCVTKPLLKEELALQNWTNQMKKRRRNQRYLAGKLNCPTDQLLMRRSDQYLEKKAFVDQFDRILHRNDPAVCFWRQEEQIGSRQIAPTLTRSERGFPPLSPVMSGDADSFISQKGKTFKLEPVKMADLEYCRHVLDQHSGKITIANQELFRQLEILGQPIILIKNQKNDAGGKGEHSVNSKGGNLKGVEYLIPNKHDANETPHELFMKLKNSWMEGQAKESIKGPALCIGGTILAYRGKDGNNIDISLKDKIIFERSVFFRDHLTNLKSFQHSNNQRYKTGWQIIGKKDITGDELVITENVDGQQGQCSQGQDDAVAKETIIMMTGRVGKVLRAHAVIENLGTTSVKFYWLKAHKPVNFDVPRKQRRTFYFDDDDGVILPNEKIYVPMLFKTTEPGIFMETWLLKTIPELELGAKIKFVFKVVVILYKPYHQEMLDVENYITKRKIKAICLTEAQKIINDAILKGSLHGQSREEKTAHSCDELFELTNPGLYYHWSSVSTLQTMYVTAIESLKPRETTNASSHRREATNKVPLVWSVKELRKLLLNMPTNASIITPALLSGMNKYVTSVPTPIPESADETSKIVQTEEDVNFRRKEDLLLALYREIGVLSFRPVKPLVSDQQMRILLVSALFQSAVHTMVTQATILAGTLELNPKERVKAKVETDKKKQSREKSKTNKDKKGGKEASVLDTRAAPIRKETYVFSAAHKMRTSSDETKDESLLAKYDEKVYCATYWILQQTIGDVVDLFEAI